MYFKFFSRLTSNNLVSRFLERQKLIFHLKLRRENKAINFPSNSNEPFNDDSGRMFSIKAGIKSRVDGKWREFNVCRVNGRRVCFFTVKKLMRRLSAFSECLNRSETVKGNIWTSDELWKKILWKWRKSLELKLTEYVIRNSLKFPSIWIQDVSLSL